MTQLLSVDAAERLAECEQRIEGRLRAMAANAIAIGNDLTVVRDERLYVASYGTFEEYAEQRWGFGARRARQFIDAAAVSGSLGTTVPKDQMPTSERQARELAPLLDDPDELRETWQETLRRTEGKPTAAAIRDVRNERRQPEALAPEPPAAVRNERDEDLPLNPDSTADDATSQDEDLFAPSNWTKPEPDPVTPAQPPARTSPESRYRAPTQTAEDRQRTAEALAQQEALNAWSRAVDGLTLALSWANTYQPPADIPPNYVTPAEFLRRADALADIAGLWKETA